MIACEIDLTVNGRLLLQFGKSPQGTTFLELSLCCCPALRGYFECSLSMIMVLLCLHLGWYLLFRSTVSSAPVFLHYLLYVVIFYFLFFSRVRRYIMFPALVPCRIAHSFLSPNFHFTLNTAPIITANCINVPRQGVR
jgi:dolichyl-phosphate-mannose--protein O-mannosyl transferase